METLRTDLTLKAEINLYYDVYVPKNIEKPAPLLLAVHGYGQHKGWIMREARAIADDRFVVARSRGRISTSSNRASGTGQASRG